MAQCSLDTSTDRWMLAWPVDFAGFDNSLSIIERIEQLLPLVRTGCEDLCWASWEIEQLQSLLYEDCGCIWNAGRLERYE